MIRHNVGAVRAQLAPQSGEEVHQGVALALGQAARNSSGDPRGAHGFAGHGVLVLPGRVQSSAAEHQDLSPPRHCGNGLTLEIGSFAQVRDVLGESSRSRRNWSRPQAVHAGQFGFVLGPEDPTPVRHDGAVTAGQDAHGTAMRRHIVEPEPQLSPHPAGGGRKILQCGLDVHVAPARPLLARVVVRR